MHNTIVYCLIAAVLHSAASLEDVNWEERREHSKLIQRAVAKQDDHAYKHEVILSFNDLPSEESLYYLGIKFGSEKYGLAAGRLDHYIDDGRLLSFRALTERLDSLTHVRYLPAHELRGPTFFSIPGKRNIKDLAGPTYWRQMMYEEKGYRKLYSLTSTSDGSVSVLNNLEQTATACHQALRTRKERYDTYNKVSRESVLALDSSLFCPHELAKDDTVNVVLGEAYVSPGGKKVITEYARLVYSGVKEPRCIGDLNRCQLLRGDTRNVVTGKEDYSYVGQPFSKEEPIYDDRIVDEMDFEEENIPFTKRSTDAPNKNDANDAPIHSRSYVETETVDPRNPSAKPFRTRTFVESDIKTKPVFQNPLKE